MSRTLIIVIDEPTSIRLATIGYELGRSINDLARTAIEEEAMNYFRGKTDPGEGIAEPPVDPFFVAEASGEIE